MSSPTSPILVVTKAFFAASAAGRRSYQKPISRYDPRPTSSHVRYRKTRLSASTSASIAATKSACAAKYQPKRGSPRMYSTE